MFENKNILIGISAGIAAYKSLYLVRLFIKSGANVKCIQTPNSKKFVTPLSLSTLSKNKVFSEFTSDKKNPTWNDHVKISQWADLFVIAPATANTISKMANGSADNILVATYLSSKNNIYIAPAMDLEMYKDNSTKKNFKTLENNGVKIIYSDYGELASGLIGEGRMSEPETIYNFIKSDLLKSLKYYNKKVLITAGPTREYIDVMRFISNKSSGKMGSELSIAFANEGANVDLILGPSTENPVHENIDIYRIETSLEMFNLSKTKFSQYDIVVFTAAVSDFKPLKLVNKKIKKDDFKFSINLTKSTDILNELGKFKKNQFLVGFALENEMKLENAKNKLIKKNLDLIVLNSLNDKNIDPFSNFNKVKILSKSGRKYDFKLKSKKNIALDIINTIYDETNL